jgi:hypothetical protein
MVNKLNDIVDAMTVPAQQLGNKAVLKKKSLGMKKKVGPTAQVAPTTSSVAKMPKAAMANQKKTKM